MEIQMNILSRSRRESWKQYIRNDKTTRRINIQGRIIKDIERTGYCGTNTDEEWIEIDGLKQYEKNSNRKMKTAKTDYRLEWRSKEAMEERRLEENDWHVTLAFKMRETILAVTNSPILFTYVLEIHKKKLD